MNKNLFVCLILCLMSSFSLSAQQKTVLFDLSHGQCQDTYPGHEYYTDIVPLYKTMIEGLGAKFVVNDSAEITPAMLKKADVLIMLSPLNKDLQKNITEQEKKALVNYVRHGRSLLFFVDEEARRVKLQEYGANDITRPFGIEFGQDVEGLPGNCGAVTFENEIFSGRLEIPFSGARLIKGGIPASVCMEQGYLHASYVKLKNGGKLFAASDTMVGQLMGYTDGTRNKANGMQTRWWGKDSRQFMSELIVWGLKK
jgi:hypothetical protein